MCFLSQSLQICSLKFSLGLRASHWYSLQNQLLDQPLSGCPLPVILLSPPCFAQQSEECLSDQ